MKTKLFLAYYWAFKSSDYEDHDINAFIFRILRFCGLKGTWATVWVKLSINWNKVFSFVQEISKLYTAVCLQKLSEAA